MFDAGRRDLTIGIVGAGVMGRGIAQIAAEAGIAVLLADARRETVDEAVAFAADMILRKAAKGAITAEAASRATTRLRATDAGPAQGYAAFSGCDLVIEAVAERMEIKHAVRDGLEAAVGGHCVIATNTSSLSVTGFAAGALKPGRIAGFHFFNPVPLMKVVEVIGGVRTEPAVLDALAALAARMGHMPVRSTDTPGFLVNHAGRGFGTEALRIAQEGVADFAAVDRIMVEAAGFRMGPFELMDLTGLDVSHAVMESIYRQYYDEPRFRPVPITAQRHAAGLFGRKVGEGFYAYREGRIDRPAAPAPAEARAADMPPAWVGGELAGELRALLAGAGARIETEATPGAGALILVAPLGRDTTMSAFDAGLDPARTLAVDGVNGFRGRLTLMRGPATEARWAEAAHALLATTGQPVEPIRDSAGFVAQRILATIVNIGCEIAQQRVAAPGDIDAAVELGLGYPKGPLALGDALGARRVLAILEAMQGFYGDPRYRPSPWLRRRAALGLSLKTPES